MRTFTLSLLLICFNLAVSAQTLKGRVVNAKNEPIPYSTVFIREVSQGLVANEQGRFQSKLVPGSYTLEVSSMGFESQKKTIQIPNSGEEIEIVLQDKVFALNEVVAHSSKEDPAYRVMRYAIAYAPFHLYQVAGYTSENYLKGSVKIEKVPALMKMMIKDDGIKSLIGRLMVMESHNEITYRSPNKYTQRVIAYKTSTPKNLEPKGGIQISTSNIYSPDVSGKVSPLSPQAFKYYNFKFERIYTEGNLQINQIKVTPKYANPSLFEGQIYVTEGDWNVYSIDLSVTEMGTTTRYKVNYQEVKPSVFLPVTFDSYTNIGTLGVKGFGRFYSSVKYKSIALNESAALVPKNRVEIGKEGVKQEKNRSKIEALAAKEKLSLKDALMLAKLSAKALEPDELKQQHESLEVKENENVKMQIDSLASKRDSTFWDNVRNVPLREDEAKSFQRVDTTLASKSVQTSNNSITIGISGSGKSSKWLYGGEWKPGKNTSLSFDGLIRGVANEYNFVDGFWLGQRMALNINTSKTTGLTTSPSIYYTTARKAMVWDVQNQFRYAPFSNGQLRLSVGNTTSDVQHETGTLRLVNSLSSLLFGDNSIRFYQNKFLHFDNEIDLANGLRITTSFGYEKRKPIENHTTFHLFGDQPHLNYPNPEYSNLIAAHTNTEFGIKLSYTPHQKYRLFDGRKSYLPSKYPTFVASYQKAVPFGSASNQSSYDKLTLSIQQVLTISRFTKLDYHVAAGGFISENKIYSPDFHYFATAPLLFTHRSFNHSFALLNNYTSSNRWIESHLTWSSDYLLFKRIKSLQRKIFDESIQMNILVDNPGKKPYLEAGYSVGLSDLGRIGFFSSYSEFTHQSSGIKISLPLLSLFGRR